MAVKRTWNSICEHLIKCSVHSTTGGMCLVNTLVLDQGQSRVVGEARV